MKSKKDVKKVRSINMNLKEAKSMANEFAEKLKDLKEVKSIVLYGSAVNGVIDNYSDLDILCFCSKIPNYGKRTKEIYEIKGIKKLKSLWYLHDSFLYKDVHVTVEYEDLKDTNKWTKQIKKKGFFMDDISSSKIRAHVENSLILYDESNIVKNLKLEISPLVRKLPDSSKWIINNLIKDWKNGGGECPVTIAIKRGNLVYANHYINRVVEKILRCVYTLNRKLYFEPKWLHVEIKKFKKVPKNFIVKINKINSAIDINKKILLVTKLIEDVRVLIK